MATLGRPRSLMHVVRSIDREAVLPRVLSPNALRTLVAYSLFVGAGNECWAGDRALADAIVCSRSTIARGKAELVKLGLVHLVPAAEWQRASKTVVHHRTVVARLDRAAIESLPTRIVSGGARYRVSAAEPSCLEAPAAPYMEGDLRKKEEEGGGKAGDSTSDTDLEPAWAVVDAVAHELDRPAPSRGDKSGRSLSKLRAEAVAASAQHWQAALRARLKAFYEKTDPWLAANRWPLGAALQIEQPQMRVQTYGGEVVAGTRRRMRIVRVGGEVVAREFVEEAQEPPASAEEVTACAARIQSLLEPDQQPAAPEG